jgi:hypothetical protein
MSDQFPIFNVPADAAEAEEAMGTKFKFWFQHPELGNCLFKQARSNTGEDWAEKIAAELAQLLGLPHARCELATWNERPGTISPAMVPENASLIHGNDILARLVSSYPRSQGYNVSEHTLDIVLQAISDPVVNLPLDWIPPNGITTAIDTFVGYLLLDAWIGNGDRHHENWGFIATIDQAVYLSPTYDHASSLGRELLDSKRQERIHNNSVIAYANRARSAFYAQPGDKKSLFTLNVFTEVARRYPNAARVWLEQLAQITSANTQELLTRIPLARISSVAVEFAHQVLNINQSRLLCLQEELL